MATADDLVTIPRLRDSLGIAGDEADAVLTGFRSAAIAWLEEWVSRSIIDRSQTTSTEEEFHYILDPDLLYFSVRDIKPTSSIVMRFSAAGNDPSGARGGVMTFAHDDPLLNRTPRGVSIYRDGDADERWDQVIRFTHPIPTITCDQGMAASDIPPQWGEACILVVRALYDGSAYDALDSMSTLTLMLKSYRPVYSIDSP